MEYTSAQVEVASRHLEAISKAKQLLVVGGVATSQEMSVRFAERFCDAADEFDLALEPRAMTHINARKNPDMLRGMKETWIIALSAGNLAVANAFKTAGAVEQPMAVTGYGAPNSGNLARMAIIAPAGLFAVKDRSGGAVETLKNAPSHILASLRAAKICTYRDAAEAQNNGVPYDLGRFKNDLFFGYTDEQLEEAAGLGVNIYELSGDHYKPHKGSDDVADMVMDYFALANMRATHRPTEDTHSPLLAS